MHGRDDMTVNVTFFGGVVSGSCGSESAECSEGGRLADAVAIGFKV